MNPLSMSESLAPKPPPRGEDLPHSDGEPMESARHFEQMILLVHSLREGWRHRHDYFVGGNMFMYFSETQSRKNDFRGPDVFVVLDTDDHERRSWVAWEEDGRLPDVIVELTSESTESIDRGQKKDLYARVLRVPFYAIFDPFSARLDAFRLVEREYRPIDPDSRGFVRCEPLGLWLGVREGSRQGIDAPWLRWIDDAGQVLPEPAESAAMEKERARKEAERARKEAERARKEAERARKEAERARKEAERARKEAERADRAEAELARLREELARRS